MGTHPVRGYLAVFIFFSVILGATASSVSCSDDPPAAGPPVDAGPDGPPPLSAEASTWVNDFCKINEPCCQSITGAGNKCVTDTARFGRGKNFDVVKAKACLDTLKNEVKNTRYCGTGPEATICVGVFRSANGKGANEACSTSADCAPGPAETEAMCVQSKCRHAKRGVEGDACIGTRRGGETEEPTTVPDGAASLCFLTDALHCDATTAKCAKQGAVAAPCTPTPRGGECVDAAYCNEDTKVCTARVAAAAACKSKNDCVKGYQCAAGSCVVAVNEGGACIRGSECDTTANLVCDSSITKCIRDTSAYERTCSGAAAIGN